MNDAATLQETISLSFPEPDVALLTLDMPGKSANVLSNSVLDELARHLDELETRDDLSGLIFLSAKPGIFIAGADLREFVASLDDITPEKTFAMCRRGQDLFARLSKTPFVTIVAIEGVCVGGGAELAVWCDRRIMSKKPKTEIGFPEVRIGIFPGWGGTVRLPRLIGLANSVEMITSGESVGPEPAFAMGLANDVVASEDLLPAAIRMVRDESRSGTYRADRERWLGPIVMSETELGFLGATASAVIQQQTKGQYPAPPAALKTMLEATQDSVSEACEREARGMSELFGTPVNAALLNVFFLTDNNKKDRGVEGEVTAKSVESVSVLGAGIMGSGIAAANVKRKLRVGLTDANREALNKGIADVMQEVAFNRQTKSADVQRAVDYAAFLNGTTSQEEIASADLVIEAIVENADVKKSVYAKLEPAMREDAILASNTSTIPITELASGLQRPEQFCGVHFFNPVRKMKLVEVIRGEKTSDETVATAVQYAKRIGKMPIVVNDGPGFLVNRLLLPYMNESLELIAEGAPIPEVEKAAKVFGMPMGPITLYDVVGLDTAFYAGRTLWEAYPDRIHASPILPALVKAGRLGQKSGKGFFAYDNPKKKGTPDPELRNFIDPYMKETRAFEAEQIMHRLFLPMLLEATRILQDRIVRDVRDVDLGLIFGLGFPPFKGGLLHWADRIGASQIVAWLKPLEDLGVRMQPTPLLEKMATENLKFYDLDLSQI